VSAFDDPQRYSSLILVDVSRRPPPPQEQDSEDVTEVDTDTGITAVARPRVNRRARRLSAAPHPGTQIGRHTVLEVLGQGGMGIVVAAYDPHLDRRVALKFLSSVDGDGHTELRHRLLREARAMAKLRHANVVSVYDVGEHEGEVYLAMEHVEGGTLRHAVAQRRAEQRADWKPILELFIAAGRGLAAAHAAGMVHRDFKPENVFVDHGGRVVVGDFGLVGARAVRDSSGGRDEPTDDRLTKAGSVVGTPAYMAPEQQNNAAVDARADQFAFCVSLYEALYGERPFAGANRAEYRRAVMRGEIRPPPPGPKVPQWLRAALVRGLAVNPEARFPSMEALLTELGDDTPRQWWYGRKARVITVGACAGFWLGSSSLRVATGGAFDYGHYYLRNMGFLAVMLLVAWFWRHVLSRTEFNRKLIRLGIGAAIALFILAAGGHMMGMPPEMLGASHLFVAGAIATTAAATIDVRFWVAAAVYLAIFLLTASWLEGLSILSFIGHATLAVCLFVVFATQRNG
jgi:hypothetical protein